MEVSVLQHQMTKIQTLSSSVQYCTKAVPNAPPFKALSTWTQLKFTLVCVPNSQMHDSLRSTGCEVNTPLQEALASTSHF